MKFKYKEKFTWKHYLIQWLDIPVQLLIIILRVLTLNLFIFTFELDWIFFKLNNSSE